MEIYVSFKVICAVQWRSSLYSHSCLDRSWWQCSVNKDMLPLWNLGPGLVVLFSSSFVCCDLSTTVLLVFMFFSTHLPQHIWSPAMYCRLCTIHSHPPWSPYPHQLTEPRANRMDSNPHGSCPIFLFYSSRLLILVVIRVSFTAYCEKKLMYTQNSNENEDLCRRAEALASIYIVYW